MKSTILVIAIISILIGVLFYTDAIKINDRDIELVNENQSLKQRNEILNAKIKYLENELKDCKSDSIKFVEFKKVR